jgi:hypothetical protein
MTNTARKEVNGLTKKDVIVVWGGAVNIAKNNSKKGLTCILDFVKQRKNTNIIIMSAPVRHDLISASCVNNEVVTFNRNLQKRMKIFENVIIIDSNIHREHFTKHGLHMNIKGKEQMALKVTDCIKKIFDERKTSPITLKWKYDLKITIQEAEGVDKDTPMKLSIDQSAMAGEVNQERNKEEIPGTQNAWKTETRKEEAKNMRSVIDQDHKSTNKHKRMTKIPKSRSDDFLWI